MSSNINVLTFTSRQYIRWVDNAMKSRGVRVDVLMLQPRWSEEAVVRRQVMEGVTGVVHLYRADRMKNKVPLRLFNRSGGANNVSFDRTSDTGFLHRVFAKSCEQNTLISTRPQRQTSSSAQSKHNHLKHHLHCSNSTACHHSSVVLLHLNTSITHLAAHRRPNKPSHHHQATPQTSPAS